MAVDNTCSICCEQFTNNLRKEVSCGSCNYDACTQCIKQFLLSSTQEPKCPNCKTLWDTNFLVSNLPKTFVNSTLKTHQKQLLLEKQLAMMPATQQAIERLERHTYVSNKYYELSYHYRMVYHTMTKAELRKKWAELEEMRLEVEAYTMPTGAVEKAAVVIEYVGPCAKEDCKGFINKKDYACGLCKTAVCKKCGIILSGGSHVCKSEDVETMKLIVKECKACPTCKAPIYKVDGCSQVWCIACKTAFNWNTGEIETGMIHTPDYYQWRRSQNPDGIIPGTVPACPNDPQAMFDTALARVGQLFKKDKEKLKKNSEILTKCWRAIGHLQYRRKKEMAKYTQAARLSEFDRYYKLRVDYMKNVIDEKAFLTKIFAKEKRRNFNALFETTCETVKTVAGDLMMRIASTNESIEIDSLVKEVHYIRDFLNDQMRRIGNVYGYVVPAICEDWTAADIHPKKSEKGSDPEVKKKEKRKGGGFPWMKEKERAQMAAAAANR